LTTEVAAEAAAGADIRLVSFERLRRKGERVGGRGREGSKSTSSTRKVRKVVTFRVLGSAERNFSSR